MTPKSFIASSIHDTPVNRNKEGYIKTIPSSNAAQANELTIDNHPNPAAATSTPVVSLAGG
jgi:hypothetical protein